MPAGRKQDAVSDIIKHLVCFVPLYYLFVVYSLSIFFVCVCVCGVCLFVVCLGFCLFGFFVSVGFYFFVVGLWFLLIGWF